MCCDILKVVQNEDGAWQVTIDLSIKTTNTLFFDESGELLGTLPATGDLISVEKLLRRLAMDREVKEEVLEAIKKEKDKCQQK